MNQFHRYKNRNIYTSNRHIFFAQPRQLTMQLFQSTRAINYNEFRVASSFGALIVHRCTRVGPLSRVVLMRTLHQRTRWGSFLPRKTTRVLCVFAIIIWKMLQWLMRVFYYYFMAVECVVWGFLTFDWSGVFFFCFVDWLCSIFLIE